MKIPSLTPARLKGDYVPVLRIELLVVPAVLRNYCSRLRIRLDKNRVPNDCEYLRLFRFREIAVSIEDQRFEQQCVIVRESCKAIWKEQYQDSHLWLSC